MGRGGDSDQLIRPRRGHKEPRVRPEEEPLFVRFLHTFRELLKFVLFSYTVLFGALLLARWTTYFMVGK